MSGAFGGPRAMDKGDGVGGREGLVGERRMGPLRSARASRIMLWRR